jgi:hypothetical protein
MQASHRAHLEWALQKLIDWRLRISVSTAVFFVGLMLPVSNGVALHCSNLVLVILASNGTVLLIQVSLTGVVTIHGASVGSAQIGTVTGKSSLLALR